MRSLSLALGLCAPLALCAADASPPGSQVNASNISGNIQLTATSVVRSEGFKPAQPDIGSGYGSIDGAVRASCLRDTTTLQETSGSNGDHTLELITSSQSLRKELGLDAAASFGFGVYSGSLAADYFSSYQTSKYTSLLHVAVNQAVGRARLVKENDAKLKSTIPDPGKYPGEFYKRCGDSVFVAADVGGNYEAFISIETENSQQQESISTTLTGSFMNFGDAALSAKISTVLTEAHAKTTSHQHIAGAIVNYPDDNPAEIIKFAQSFPTTIKEHFADNLRSGYQIQSYGRMIDGFSSAGGKGAAFLENLAEKFEMLSQLMGSVRYIKTHPDQFSARFSLPDDIEDKIDATIRKIREVASICAVDQQNCDAKVPDLPYEGRLPEQLLWFPANGSTLQTFDSFVKSFGFQTVGNVPEGVERVLEARGVWFCGGDRNARKCPQTAFQYQVVSSTGQIVEAGVVSTTPVTIKHSGEVRVRANDGPGVPEFADNLADPTSLPQVSIW